MCPLPSYKVSPQQRRLWVKLPADALAILGCEPNVRMFLHKRSMVSWMRPEDGFWRLHADYLVWVSEYTLLTLASFLLYEQDFPEGREQPAPPEELLGPPRTLCYGLHPCG